ncbi:MAG: arylsulfatase [Planctomycetota bacterium]
MTLFVATLTLFAQVNAFAKSPPHVVFLVADDLGFGDVGYNGSRIETPNINALAKRGVRLTQFYVQPVCSPTRAALLTGRYPYRYGMQVGVVRPWADYGVPLEEELLPSLLRSAGYRTFAIGKWHLGHARKEYLPIARGFDHHYGCYNGAIDYYRHERDGGLDWHRNGDPVREQGYATRLIAKEACRILDEHRPENPLFLYVPFTAVHTPIQAPKEAQKEYSHFKYRHRQVYAAMTSELDRAVGRIMRQLAESNFDPTNTFIVFFSDNGGIPKYGSNGGLRGQKGQVYEGGIRVPAIVVWEGELEAGKSVETPLHAVDWFPTVLKVAGVDLPKTEIDGIDLLPMLRHNQSNPNRVMVHNVTSAHAAIRIGDFKVVHNGHVNAIQAKSDDDTWEVFDIANDPSEQTNLADQMPIKLTRFKRVVADLRAKSVKPLAKGAKPDDFVVPEVWGNAD